MRKITLSFITFILAAFIGVTASTETVRADIPKDYYYKLLPDKDHQEAFSAYKKLINGPYLEIEGDDEEARLDKLTDEELASWTEKGALATVELEDKSLTDEDLPFMVTTVFEAMEFDDLMNVRCQILSLQADAVVKNGTLYVGYVNPPKYDYDDLQKQAEAKKAEIISTVKADNRYQDVPAIKEYLVHNYLCANVTYDGKSAAGDGDRLYIGHSVYGALVENNAVCDAISMSCAAILKDLGVDCYVIGGESHAWNMVVLDGELYELDCTWDMKQFSDYGRTEHTYFNVTTDYMTKTEHNRESLSQLMPEATGSIYTYEKVISDIGMIIGDHTADGIIYNLDGEMMATVKGMETATNILVIPSVVKVNGLDYTVMFIDDEAFKDSTLKKVTFPETLLLIGKEAFAGCKKLKNVIIKDAAALQIIDENAFNNSRKKIIFKISGDKESFKKVKEALQNSGVRKGVYKRQKQER